MKVVGYRVKKASYDERHKRHLNSPSDAAESPIGRDLGGSLHNLRHLAIAGTEQEQEEEETR
jgi:hypothetical protein